MTLKCLVEGKPTPIIAWTRLSDNSVVTMPLINISRHDVIDYRCTADNVLEPLQLDTLSLMCNVSFAVKKHAHI